MKNKIVVLAAALFLSCGFLLHAQVDTRGTDFWIAFGDNAASTSMQIRIAGAGQAANGHIHFTALGTSVPFSVPAHGVFTYVLTEAQRGAVANMATGVSNRSVRITSSVPVMVYALNQQSATTDATNVLPVPTLGTDYFHISYRPLNVDRYLVVAIENATQVFHDGALVATLNAGEVYARSGANTEDMTGVHITASEPVAFFNVNSGPQVPFGTRFVDRQFQQLPPVNTWGRNFFVPVTHRGVERVRIVATQDDTDITQVGGVVVSDATGSQNRLTNLNTGQWVELEIRLAQRGAFIQANNPVGVCAFMVGTEFPGLYVAPGDPSTGWIPAIEQMIPSATIAPFIPVASTNLNQHFALIVVRTDAKNLTYMAVGGGTLVPISGGTWYDHPTAGYSFYILQLANDANITYTFSNPEGLLVMGYGIGGPESYYYVAGSAFRTLDAAFFANDIHNQELAANVMHTNQINFRAEIQGAMSSNAGHIRWLIDGAEETSARDQLTWSRNLPNGTYVVVLEVLMDDNITVRRVEGTLIIATATIKVNPHINKRVTED
ncbi:MAG: IgGFc-binding protein [Defluviitaleaceae bacterium]|nr:IgGFc-binding protein [Defluviitaleaceae bacterium]